MVFIKVKVTVNHTTLVKQAEHVKIVIQNLLKKLSSVKATVFILNKFLINENHPFLKLEND